MSKPRALAGIPFATDLAPFVMPAGKVRTRGAAGHATLDGAAAPASVPLARAPTTDSGWPARHPVGNGRLPDRGVNGPWGWTGSSRDGMKARPSLTAWLMSPVDAKDPQP